MECNIIACDIDIFRISGNAASNKNIHGTVSEQLKKNFAKSRWKVGIVDWLALIICLCPPGAVGMSPTCVMVAASVSCSHSNTADATVGTKQRPAATATGGHRHDRPLQRQPHGTRTIANQLQSAYCATRVDAFQQSQQQQQLKHTSNIQLRCLPCRAWWLRISLHTSFQSPLPITHRLYVCATNASCCEAAHAPLFYETMCRSLGSNGTQEKLKYRTKNFFIKKKWRTYISRDAV